MRVEPSDEGDGRPASGVAADYGGDVWNDGDDDAVAVTLAPDFVFRGSLGDETAGRDGWRTYRALVRAGSADFRTEILDLVCQPGRAAARVRCSGHHTGPLLGISPDRTRRPFAYQVAAFFRVAGGLLAEAWVLGDLDSLRRQLTAPTAPDGA